MKLTIAQMRALEGIDLARGSRGASMETLRYNGHRRDVVDRLCELDLAYAAGDYGDPDRVRFELTDAGRRYIDAPPVRVTKGPYSGRWEVFAGRDHIGWVIRDDSGNWDGYARVPYGPGRQVAAECATRRDAADEVWNRASR